MNSSFCLCGDLKTSFREMIVYKNETVFSQYEGTVIGKCTHCGLLKTFPAKKNKTFDPKQSRSEMYGEKRKFFRELFKPIVDGIGKYIRRGTVLDIGCSSGILMELLEENNYDVRGIEPNLIAAKEGQKHFGTRIFTGTTAEFLKKHHSKFDVVIYNHVLEHVEKVNEEFARAKKLLKDRGLLVVGIPNTRNIIFFLRQKYWEPLMPNEHIWHFSDTYFSSLLKKNGFTVLEKSFADDKREDYPKAKRIYFGIVLLMNRMVGTGESVLIIAQKQAI